MSEMVQLFSPVGASKVAQYPVAPRLTQLEGRSVAYLDNMKSNADLLLARLAEIFARDHGVSDAVTYRKKFTTATAFPKEVNDEIVARCDGAITAIGD